jgi:CheY-like chemotaxis protein
MISLLEHWGFQVAAAATNFQSAVHYLESQRFDIVLSDIGLPDGTGFAVMEHAKRHQPGIIGIAISAFHSPLELQLGERVGFDHFMPKPVDVQRLHAILDRAAA